MFFQSPCIKQTLISITPFAARYKENHKNDTKGVCFRRRRMIFLRRAAPQKGNKLDTSAFILYIMKDKSATITERKSEHDLVLSDKGMPLGIYRKRTRAGLPGVRQAEPAPRDARAAEELRARTDGSAAAKDLLSARFRAERKRTSDAFYAFRKFFHCESSVVDIGLFFSFTLPFTAHLSERGGKLSESLHQRGCSQAPLRELLPDH